MKEIPITTKQNVIKLFLSGLSYDEISLQTGVAKGSVVNIVDAFREGEIPLDGVTAAYVDELRHLVVDMKKQGTAVPQLKTYLKLHTKLKEMGVPNEKVEDWLDICQGIATTGVSNSEFVSAALELAQVTKETGVGYVAAINDHKARIKLSKELATQIDQQKKEKVQGTKELDSITKAITTSQEAYAKQTKELKSGLDEHLAQHKLTMDKVDKVAAMVHSELGEAGLGDEAIETISKQIAGTGSLTTYNQQLQETNNQLLAEVDGLGKKKAMLIGAENIGTKRVGELIQSITDKIGQERALDATLKGKNAELTKLNQIYSCCADVVRGGLLVKAFLDTSDDITDYQFDQFVSMMIGCRRVRLGVEPKEVKDASGKVICRCLVPEGNLVITDCDAEMEKARQELALWLVPLVKDKFVSKFDYDMEQSAKQQDKLISECWDKLAKLKSY